MKHQSQLDEELERRLVELETAESDDPVHAALGARSFAVFLLVVFGVVAVAWIGVAL